MSLLAIALHLASSLQPGDPIPGKPEYNELLAQRLARRLEPGFWIELSNQTYRESESVVVSGEPPKAGAMAMELLGTEGKDSGKVVGSMQSRTDPTFIETAVAYLDSALVHRPDRIDIQIGKSQLWRALGDCRKEREALKSFYRFSLDSSRTPKSGDETSISDRNGLVVDEFIFAAKEHWDKSDDACLKGIARDFLGFQPRSVVPMNFLASIYTIAKNDSAIVWFDKALAIAPDDAVVLGNKATFLVNTGDKAKAKETFRKAVAVCKEERLCQNLKKDLKKLH